LCPNAMALSKGSGLCSLNWERSLVLGLFSRFCPSLRCRGYSVQMRWQVSLHSALLNRPTAKMHLGLMTHLGLVNLLPLASLLSYPLMLLFSDPIFHILSIQFTLFFEILSGLIYSCRTSSYFIRQDCQ